MFRKVNVLLFVGGFILLSLGFSSPGLAIQVTMKRIIFEGPKRTETLILINDSNNEMTYRMGWQHKIMREDNGFKTIDNPEDAPETMKQIEDMVRFAPRRITIPPRTAQKIRIMLRRPSGLADGEYRSHFLISPEPPTKKLTFEKDLKGTEQFEETATAVQLKMLAGVSVPVFVRQGELSAEASISELNASKNTDKKTVDLSFYINRSGNKSLYGDIDVICKSLNGEETVIKRTRGIAVYTEVVRRQLKHEVLLSGEALQACQTVRVEYWTTPEIGERKVVREEQSLFASAEAPLQ